MKIILYPIGFILAWSYIGLFFILIDEFGFFVGLIIYLILGAFLSFLFQFVPDVLSKRNTYKTKEHKKNNSDGL